MTRYDLWLFLAGAVAASVNAAAGGGTLLSFPALLAAGMTPLAANTTSTVGLLPGGLASLWAYRGEIAAARRDAWAIGIPGVLGGALGAWLLLRLGNDVFDKVVPVLLLGAAALLLLQPLVSRWSARRAGVKGHSSLLAASACAGLIAVYGGYFGAGQGILFLGAMGLVLSVRPLSEVNALKVLSASIANGVAAAVFVLSEARHPTGALHWRDALPVAVGAVVGGYGGVHVVRRLSPNVLRGVAALVGVAIGVYLAVR